MSATLLRNDHPGGNRVIVALRGTRSNRYGVGATVRIESESGVQVRSLVLARGYLSTSEPVLHFGLGDDPHIDRLVISWPSGIRQELNEGLPAADDGWAAGLRRALQHEGAQAAVRGTARRLTSRCGR